MKILRKRNNTEREVDKIEKCKINKTESWKRWDTYISLYKGT